jgi:hypothetical protein
MEEREKEREPPMSAAALCRYCRPAEEKERGNVFLLFLFFSIFC